MEMAPPQKSEAPRLAAGRPKVCNARWQLVVSMSFGKFREA